MKILAFEGLDKSGKATMTRLLEDYLADRGYSVVTTSFHRYDTLTGRLVRKWLYKNWNIEEELEELKEVKGVEQQLWYQELLEVGLENVRIDLIMSADKEAQQEWFNELESQGTDLLIIDRYIGSQACYSLAQGNDKDWVYSLHANLRKPDLELLLDIEPETSVNRKGEHGHNDRYEEDVVFLTNVRKAYREYFSVGENRMTIRAREAGIEDIFEVVKGVVRPYLVTK